MKMKWIFLSLWLLVSGLVFLFVFQLNPRVMGKWWLGDALLLSLISPIIVFAVLFIVVVIVAVAVVMSVLVGSNGDQQLDP